MPSIVSMIIYFFNISHSIMDRVENVIKLINEMKLVYYFACER